MQGIHPDETTLGDGTSINLFTFLKPDLVTISTYIWKHNCNLTASYFKNQQNSKQNIMKFQVNLLALEYWYNMIKRAYIFYEVIIKSQILSNNFILKNPRSFAI